MFYSLFLSTQKFTIAIEKGHAIARLAVFTTFCLVAISIQAAQTDRAFIWEVEGNNSKVYLMGSVHFANSSFYPLRPAIQNAFDRSDNLVVEVDMQNIDPMATQQMIMQLGTYPDDQSLRDNISPATWKKLEAKLKAAGMPAELFAKQKPGLIVITLTSLELLKLGLSPDQGIDLHFLNQARGKKNILELETLEQQMALLLGSENGEQMLAQTLDEFEQYGEFIDILTRAWRSGNSKEMEELLIHKPLRDYPQSRALFDKMFTQRNQKMTSKIRRFLGGGENYFVVVGAGHLIGEGGIVNLLRKAGFKTKRL